MDYACTLNAPSSCPAAFNSGDSHTTCPSLTISNTHGTSSVSGKGYLHKHTIIDHTSLTLSTCNNAISAERHTVVVETILYNLTSLTDICEMDSRKSKCSSGRGSIARGSTQPSKGLVSHMITRTSRRGREFGIRIIWCSSMSEK